MSGQKAVSLRALVRGRVQAVGFRDFVYTRARILGVTGYVRNLSDGLSVEVIAEGQRSKLEQLLEYLREGPRLSRVAGIESEWGEATDAYDRFGVAF